MEQGSSYLLSLSSVKLFRSNVKVSRSSSFGCWLKLSLEPWSCLQLLCLRTILGQLIVKIFSVFPTIAILDRLHGRNHAWIQLSNRWFLLSRWFSFFVSKLPSKFVNATTLLAGLRYSQLTMGLFNYNLPRFSILTVSNYKTQKLQYHKR